MGDAIARDAFTLAEGYFNRLITSVSNESLTASQEISIYPNPATDKIHLSIPSELIINKISLTDIQGRLIIEETGVLDDLDVSGAKPGIYILHLNHSRGLLSHRIVIK